jgi:dihydroflavonol-4-reductase
MRVLITGATGFLGGHLCRRMVSDGHEVTILRRPTSDVAGVDGLDVVPMVGDVTDGPSLDPAVKGQEVVVHAAARGGTADAPASVNVEGTRNVVVACRRYGVRRLVHVSSAAAIGIPDRGDDPADERFAFNLDHLAGRGFDYHISKRRAEEVVNDVGADVDAVIVNPGWIWGPFGRGFRGSEVIDGVIRRPIVPCFRGGCNIVHVTDVVDGIVAALARGRTRERYILGGENLRHRKIAEIIADGLGVKRLLVPVPPLVTAVAASALPFLGRLRGTRPRITRDTHYYTSRSVFYDSTKARMQLGYAPRPFADIVRDYARHRMRDTA